jgi:PAS domain S-box-containing protein
MVGYTVDELQELSVQELTHPEDLQTDLDLMNEVVAGKRDRYILEKRYIARSGDTVYGRLHVGVVRKDDGSIDYFISQIVDITAEKKLLHKLQNKTEYLSNLNRILVHDLRGPLANQATLLDMLQSGDTGLEQEELLSLIVETNHAMLTQVNGLLLVARLPDDGNAPIERCELSEVLDAITPRLVPSAEGKAARIRRELEIEEVLYPRPLLESVMYNFLSNGVKYAREGVVPELQVQSYMAVDGRTAIAFRDNGRGMDLNSEAFRLFGLGQVEKANASATGLGLYIVKKQVERLGGNITVESVPGEGSTFTLFIKN